MRLTRVPPPARPPQYRVGLGIPLDWAPGDGSAAAAPAPVSAPGASASPLRVISFGTFDEAVDAHFSRLDLQARGGVVNCREGEGAPK